MEKLSDEIPHSQGNKCLHHPIIDFLKTIFAARTSLKREMSWRLSGDLDILHLLQLSFIQLHEVISSTSDWKKHRLMDELVIWVMSVMRERPATGFPPLIASFHSQAVSFYQITDVCLPIQLAGQCQLIIPLAIICTVMCYAWLMPLN